MEYKTEQELEEELVFQGIMRETLDPGADDYHMNLQRIDADTAMYQNQLDALRSGSRPQSSSSNQNPRHMNGFAEQPRDGWWQAAMDGRPQNNQSNFADDMANKPLYDSPGATGLPQSDPPQHTPGNSNANKRARTQSTLMMEPFEHASKRPTPEPVNVGTPASSDGSYDFADRPVDRMRTSQAASYAALQRHREQQQKDEAFARQMSQSGTPSHGFASSSARPNVQTTLNYNGSYQRPPRPVQAESSASASRTYQPAPLTGYHHAYQPHPEHEPPRRVKSEYGLQQQLPQRSRQQPAVVDLTGSDSEDDEIAEIAPNNFAPSSRNPIPSGSNMRSLHTQPSTTLQMPTTMQMPGTFPNLNQTNNHYGYGNGGMVYSNPGSQWLRNGVANTFGRLSGGLSELGNLVYGSNNAPLELDSDDDDDVVFGGSRVLPGMYSGNEDLYNSRYDMFSNYDPSKSKEEIQAMLENIRPDEEMPAHLRVRTPQDMNVELHKYQELGLTWLQKCEEGNNKGGILADDMGLGKTIQMLSLIVTRKSQDPRCKTTLIVAPVALMRQWKQEIQNRLKPGRFQLTVFTHHGQKKAKSFNDLRAYDVVLTTYGSLASELKKMEKFRLRQRADPGARPYPAERCVFLDPDARWYRIILDEAQCIKNRTTQTSKAACMINATYRFCVTGTPMMNNVEEFYSLLKFLRVKPYCQWERFRLDINMPLRSQNEDFRNKAMRMLQAVCKSVMLRRTKKSTFEGKPILVLPEKHVVVDHPQFSDDEMEFYQSIETKTQLQFNKYLRRGTVGTQYSAILVLLLRLRQACCHPHLLKDFGVAAAADLGEDQLLELAKQLEAPVVARIKETGGNFECPVCYDVTPNPAIFIPCGHDTCSECFAKIADPANAVQRGEEGGGARCPNCRGHIDAKRLTDFNSFKRVHMPELLTDAERQADDAQDDNESASDDSSDSDTEGESDEDDGADLKDFIVDDDEEPEQAGDDDETDDDLDAKPVKKERVKQEGVIAGPSSTSKGKQPKKDRKGKGKAKKKGKKQKSAVTLAELKKQGTRNKAQKKKYLRRLRKDWQSSAKIEKTMEILNEIMDDQEGEQVLIFSQWTSLLDLLEVPIDEAGIGYRRYDGSMSAAMRGDAVDDFRDQRKNVRVMLVSLKAGNAGLNLNMASQVIILDPFWNPYIEEQAIDRAHRLGQRREVKVHRILIENTVEDRIIALQEKKRALISEALDEQQAANLGRLGVQELAYLFGVTHDPSQRINYVPQRQR
ncbi:hypothetical protein DOTSEDRAFT_70055 [Dothistroma septosporum NZE10]|uniref:Uncharacterized protein n=1 Tax=Dothistroma septosporum (strain NZE10 / CBS 128990) TaxID=675120 RepID=N1PR86_DOTSN|nr:hypothetical protein DOTSEDRAFT_70055 [Dothistroma septosporum NZE10]